MNVAVVGAGAMGSLFGALLAEAGADVDGQVLVTHDMVGLFDKCCKFG